MKEILCIFCLSNIFASELLAGVYGNLGVIYEELKNDSPEYELNDKNFIQNYMAGYRGSIYNRNLLKYTVEGSLRYENRNAFVNELETTTKVDSINYKVIVGLLKKNKVPYKYIYI